MHLAIDAVGAKHSGGAIVLGDVVRAALEEQRLRRITIFSTPSEDRAFEFPSDGRLSDAPQPLAERSAFGRLLWYERGLARATKAIGADVLLCMNGAGAAPGGVRHVVFIQQALLFSKEAISTFKWPGRLRIEMIRQLTRRACLNADRIIVQTPVMASALTEQFGVNPERVGVIEPDIDVLPPSRDTAATRAMVAAPEGRRLLYVGNDSPYKNLEILPTAIDEIRDAFPDVRLFVTLRADHPLVRAGIVPLGYLSRSELRLAYERATVLVMPSRVESLGLPMLEAMSMGVPVLAADRPYAHAVGGDAVTPFDPDSASDLASKAIQLLSTEEERARRAALGRAIIDRRRSERPYQRLVRELVGDIEC